MITLNENEIISLGDAAGTFSIADVLESIISPRFDPSDVMVGDFSYAGSANASFLLGPVDLGVYGRLEGGLLLTTGAKPDFSNSTLAFTNSNALPGDEDLTKIITEANSKVTDTYDASTIEFTVNIIDPKIKGIQFLVNFATEEFPYYMQGEFSDVSAIIVNGTNYANFGGELNRPLSIMEANLSYFIDNQYGVLPIEYNAVTQNLILSVPVQQGENFIKIGVADASDDGVDSALFIKDIQPLETLILPSELIVDWTGGDERDVFYGTSNAEFYDLKNGPDDIIFGNVNDINRDFIKNFWMNDRIIFKDTQLSSENFTYDKEKGQIDIDLNKDGSSDVSFTMIGDLSFGSMTIKDEGEDTSFSFSISPGVSSGLLPLFSAHSQLQIIYAGYFARPADQDGFKFWVEQNVAAQNSGQNAELALTNIANSFRPQSETLANYPLLGASNLNLKDPLAQSQLSSFIDNVYANLFNRMPDSEGKAYWVNQITSGAVGVGAAVLAIANGATGDDAVSIANKVEVANIFTQETAALGRTVDFAFLNAAKNAAASVSFDGSSFDTALAIIQNYLVNSGGGSVTPPSTQPLAAAMPNEVTLVGVGIEGF